MREREETHGIEKEALALALELRLQRSGARRERGSKTPLHNSPRDGRRGGENGATAHPAWKSGKGKARPAGATGRSWRTRCHGGAAPKGSWDALGAWKPSTLLAGRSQRRQTSWPSPGTHVSRLRVCDALSRASGAFRGRELNSAEDKQRWRHTGSGNSHRSFSAHGEGWLHCAPRASPPDETMGCGDAGPRRSPLLTRGAGGWFGTPPLLPTPILIPGRAGSSIRRGNPEAGGAPAPGPGVSGTMASGVGAREPASFAGLAHLPASDPPGKGSEGHVPGKAGPAQSPCGATDRDSPLSTAPNPGCASPGHSRRPVTFNSYFPGSTPTTAAAWVGSVPTRDFWGPSVTHCVVAVLCPPPPHLTGSRCSLVWGSFSGPG